MEWLHEPPSWGQVKEYLWVLTDSDTDLWQRTHYGFIRDTAHMYMRPVSGDFTLSARFHFYPESQYDQCGLVVRRNDQCWFKCSTEYEDEHISRLGSVLTSYGHSDWATQDIDSQINDIWYSLEFHDGDLTVSFSYDGEIYHQMRICHLHSGTQRLSAGIYGCSPKGQGFRFEVSELSIQNPPV